MPPTPRRSPRPRAPAVVNEEIRALWVTSGGVLSAKQRAEYEQLLAEWAAAVRGEVESVV